jgi:methylthioribose-1-phosphate isomerase
MTRRESTNVQDMAVRGAPAIAISAALGLAVELVNKGAGAQFESAQAACDAIKQQLDYLVTRYASISTRSRFTLYCIDWQC